MVLIHPSSNYGEDFKVHGSVSLGRNVTIGRSVTLENNVCLHDDSSIGDNVVLGHNVVVYAGTIIGNGTYIDDNTVLGRQPRSGTTSTKKTSSQLPLSIGENVVVGTSVVIYAGTSIADSSFVGDLVSMRERCFIGRGTRIGRSNTIESDAYFGENVVLQCGSHVTVACRLEDGVFFGTQVCTMNDKYMMTINGYNLEAPIIHAGAAVGSNATLLPSVSVGYNSIVGAGAVVTKSIPDNELWTGVPAKFLRKID